MAFFQVQNNMLSLLHYQHRLYTSELAKSHRTLGKLYKKLERTERGLSDWKERGLKRKDKKRLQWDRATTKAAIKESEAQQALLHNYLGQCSDLIASYSPHFFQASAMPWTSSPLSATAYPFAPDSTGPPTPWTAGPFEERATWSRQAPQYWDLSMLRERRSPLPSGTPDSGFDEPLRRGVMNNFHSMNDEMGQLVTGAAEPIVSSATSSISEKDILSELIAPSSPAKLCAEGPQGHRRRYSENAIQMIEARLAAKRSRVGSVPPFNRTASETTLSKE